MGSDRAADEAADLRFARVPAVQLAEVRHHGLVATSVRYDSFEAALGDRRPDDAVLVVSGRPGGERVPPEAIANLDPYRPPFPMEAAGGVVVRARAKGPEVLLIFRRGAWDLPKGKRDDGETLEECALREVREEVGIRHLDLLAPAGHTVHGYPEKDRYAVKRTAWYFMRTPETDFQPETSEGIERVEWVPWHEARARLGFTTLRSLLERLGPEAAMEALG
jgi:8-oxo-dGTP pyrophosphatase MutT (NUDIX family)